MGALHARTLATQSRVEIYKSGFQIVRAFKAHVMERWHIEDIERTMFRGFRRHFHDYLNRIFHDYMDHPSSGHANSECGQYLVQTVILLPMMMILVGLVVDGGWMYWQYRRAEIAVNAAAQAASHAIDVEYFRETNQVRLVSKRSIHDGQWHHVAAAYDGQRAALYLDGVLEDSVSASGRIARGAGGPITMGQNPSAGRRYFSGWMDEVRLYGCGLGAEDVLRLYRDGAN